ncbi:MAG: Arc family DNA-binding protein [Alphaproteobacteria bacterium]|nr:Arc family DNA-binding protein [Alphaproteobacteria bacterium]
MGQVLIRKVPEDVIDVLKACARSNHRSLEEELRHLLIEAAKPPRQQLKAAAAAMRSRLAGERALDTLSLLRELREP